jgi:hypothetical protein
MFKKFKKSLSIITISVLMLAYIVPAVPVFADDQTDMNSTPSQTQVDNSTTSTVDSTTNSDTGNNTINPTDTPTPDSVTPTEDPSVTPTDTTTPTPTDTPTSDSVTPTDTPTPDSVTPTDDPSLSPTDTPTDTPVPDGGISVANSADTSSNISSDANTGENSTNYSVAPTDGGQSSQNDSPNYSPNQTNQSSNNTIDTGNSNSTTNIENTINTTAVNSDIIYQTVNIILNQDNNIDLSDPITIAANVLAQDPNDPEISVAATSVTNYAIVSNDIVSTANTGDNTINGSKNNSITTGDAYSIVSLLNKVNVVVINSQVHIVSINVYGDLNGNIILPDVNASTNCATCGISLNAENTATVTNNVDSTANSGDNSATGKDASITTGSANSQVDTLNLVNTSVIGSNVQVLYINTFGTWDGSFIGWGNIDPQAGGASLALMNATPGTGDGTCSSCSAGDTSINNNATVVNNVTSSANTGSNAVTGKNSTVTTGNAFSLVSIINLVNSNFINSFGFIGFINIFGTWHGNIGGAAEFAKLNGGDNNNPGGDQIAQLPSDSSNSQPEVRQDGGQLNVTQTNNTGDHILPGDTVTFFVNVNNPGSGKVYETKLNLYLIKDGQNVGVATYDLGAIDPGKTVKITTGLVMSDKAPAGDYIARAFVQGSIGTGSDNVSAQADSLFKVFGPTKSILTAASTFNKPKTNAVLGAQYPKPVLKVNGSNSAAALYALLDVILAYIVFRVFRYRKRLAEILAKNMSIKERLSSLRMFLL